LGPNCEKLPRKKVEKSKNLEARNPKVPEGGKRHLSRENSLQKKGNNAFKNVNQTTRDEFPGVNNQIDLLNVMNRETLGKVWLLKKRRHGSLGERRKIRGENRHGIACLEDVFTKRARLFGGGAGVIGGRSKKRRRKHRNGRPLKKKYLEVGVASLSKETH